METLLQVLMRRDNMSEKDAKELIKDCKKQVSEGEDPEEVLYDLGLEPDFIFEIL